MTIWADAGTRQIALNNGQQAAEHDPPNRRAYQVNKHLAQVFLTKSEITAELVPLIL